MEGVRVLSVTGPASSADIRPGDVILTADDIVVGKSNNQNPFGTIVHFKEIGSTLRLSILRNGSVINKNLTISAIPDQYNYLFTDTQSIGKLHSKETNIFI